MANSVDPDGMAHYEPSHLALHCVQRYIQEIGLPGWRSYLSEATNVFIWSHELFSISVYLLYLP